MSPGVLPKPERGCQKKLRKINGINSLLINQINESKNKHENTQKHPALEFAADGNAGIDRLFDKTWRLGEIELVK
jgi:hypothetical protein